MITADGGNGESGGRARRRALRALDDITRGGVQIREGGAAMAGDAAADARIDIRDARAYAAFLRGGLAAADAYISGWWDSPDLALLMRRLAENIAAANRALEGTWRRWPRRLLWLLHAARAAMFSRLQARRHVGAHYDLSNDFFAAFLDESMAYSCAIYPQAGATLAAAQDFKHETLCRKLALNDGDHLLDLGCGWGALSMHAAQCCGCRITALTLSARQCAFTGGRFAGARLGGRARAVRADYRDFAPARRFSKIASVEMIEAVGAGQFGAYFRQIRRLLTADGRAVVQAILIPHERYAAAAREPDFINRRIFPGGALPSEEIVRRAAAAAGLRFCGGERIGLHYAPTLAAWRRRFNENFGRIRAAGFDDTFRRMWNYYFCYCEGGFAAGALDDAQFVFAAQ